MGRSPIVKVPGDWPVAPNLTDHEAACAELSWEAEERALARACRAHGFHIAALAVDRHAAGARARHVALRWLARSGEVRDYTYADLRERTNRFANVLRGLGVGVGDRVFALAGRVPELYVAALGALKNGSVFCPLFSAFGPEPIRQRLSLGGARVLVTTERLYRRKVAALRPSLPDLAHILLIPDEGRCVDEPGVGDLRVLMEEAPARFEAPEIQPEDMALLHFTSGTTGPPKAAVHVHRAVVVHHVSAALALDLHPEDTFWCTADPGWVTGTSYGIVAPLTHGVTSIVDEAEFDAERWYGVLQDHAVDVWYTAPTAIRMLMRAGTGLARQFDLSGLRHVASVGEPLDPEAVVWGQQALGRPIHDTWWQTETGGIMVANYAALEIRPGSMGLALPGIEAGIVRRREDGGVDRVAEPGGQGELALRAGWPSMFRGYLNEDERYRRCFRDGWYLTGDLARRDADGYLWFVGRADDVIKTAGHLVGPFEVESVLREHPDVGDVAVVGKPDPVAGEIVKAFVALRPGAHWNADLRLALLAFARSRLGPAVAPREIDPCPAIPKTRSGKILRRVLVARERGGPVGDLSTLEAEGEDA
ncbi:MAG: acetate--CoA ligase [Myxococcota bacterium]